MKQLPGVAMNHLLNVLDGFASAFTWGPSSQAYPTTKQGFQRDQEKLRGDVKAVGRDMKNTLKEYGEPILEGRSEERKG
jgi:hypothetical protein